MPPPDVSYDDLEEAVGRTLLSVVHHDFSFDSWLLLHRALKGGSAPTAEQMPPGAPVFLQWWRMGLLERRDLAHEVASRWGELSVPLWAATAHHPAAIDVVGHLVAATAGADPRSAVPLLTHYLAMRGAHDLPAAWGRDHVDSRHIELVERLMAIHAWAAPWVRRAAAKDAATRRAAGDPACKLRAVPASLRGLEAWRAGAPLPVHGLRWYGVPLDADEAADALWQAAARGGNPPVAVWLDPPRQHRERTPPLLIALSTADAGRAAGYDLVSGDGVVLERTFHSPRGWAARHDGSACGSARRRIGR